MDSRDGVIGRIAPSVADAARRLARRARSVLSRLALRYPALLRFLSTPRPLNIYRYPHAGPDTRRDLLVCLPGIGDHAKDFEAWGFVELVRASRWTVDILLVDAHYGYYADRTILDQLRRDVFLPASASGYRSIWLAGISMGGLGALLYASRYEQDLTGVIAVAPFLGSRALVQEMSLSGGLARWSSTVTTSDEICEVWTWLKAREHQSHPRPDIHLAFGEDDVFSEGHRVMASTLPEAHVLTVSGGHRWSVWRQLWAEFLRRRLAAHRSPDDGSRDSNAAPP